MKLISRKTANSLDIMPPLIVLGMHRSGTSLVVRLLTSIGVHMGHRLSRDAESIFFQKLNRRIYSGVGAKWGYVARLIQAMRSQHFLEHQTSAMRAAVFHAKRPLSKEPRISKFFGPGRWKTIQTHEPVHWGWKDPRTTLTFPIWLRVFPQAKILHILRNGIDVAISMHRRSLKQRSKIWKRLFPLDYCPATLEFDYCFRLWEEYVSFVFDHVHLVPDGHYLEIRFEDLLRDSVNELRRIADFTGYQVRDDELNLACRQIDRSRLDNSSFAAAYQNQIPAYAASSLLQKLGYRYCL